MPLDEAKQTQLTPLFLPKRHLWSQESFWGTKTVEDPLHFTQVAGGVWFILLGFNSASHAQVPTFAMSGWFSKLFSNLLGMIPGIGLVKPTTFLQYFPSANFSKAGVGGQPELPRLAKHATCAAKLHRATNRMVHRVMKNSWGQIFPYQNILSLAKKVTNSSTCIWYDPTL